MRIDTTTNVEQLPFIVVSNNNFLTRTEFPINVGYKKLYFESGEDILQPVNNFFKALPDAQSNILNQFYDFAKETLVIEKDSKASVQDVVSIIQTEFDKVCNEIDLLDRLCSFIPSSYLYSQCQIEEYHKEENGVKFFSINGVDLIALSILCKMLVPIWSTLNEMYFIRSDANTLLINTLFNYTLNSRLFSTIDKIKLYIKEYASSNWKMYTADDDSLTPEILNSTLCTICNRVFSMLLVKRLIDVDLTNENGSIIIWITTCIKQSFISEVNRYRMDRYSPYKKK